MIADAISGAAGLLLIVAWSLCRREARRRWDDLLTVAAFAVYGIMALNLTDVLLLTRGPTLDLSLLTLDRRLGFDTLQFVHWAQWHRPVFSVLLVVYLFHGVVMSLAWCAEQNPVLRKAILLGGVLCFVGYALVPAVGPGLYDWRGEMAPGLSPGNCVPSMHFGWALLLLINARAKWLIVVLGIYVDLIAFATVGIGEHYVIDLIVTLPFVALVQWLAAEPVPVAVTVRERPIV